MKYSIGIDFGTNSVRAVLVNLDRGKVAAESESKYPSGVDGVIGDEKNPHLARQNPSDYHICLEEVVKKIVLQAKKNRKFSLDDIVGIGVDTTGSTPIPVDKDLIPISFLKDFKNNKNAMAWLWKDHTSAEEAEEITELARKIRPEYLAKIGGVYSSEWFFSKILHLARVDKKVFQKSASFVELADYIPAILTGKKNPEEVMRCICAAGHKAMYSEEWKGLPDKKFLSKLNPLFKGLRKKLYEKAYPAGVIAGYLCRKWAKKFSIPENIPVSVGAFDAHMGAVGAGIKPNTLVKIIGTSTCDMMIFPKGENLPDIPGLCGIVPDSIVPGYVGLEAGQSAVGDIFYWFVKTFIPEFHKDPYGYFEDKAKKLKAGQSGLLALDWNNGNRTVLVDQKLTGLILGFTLNTKPEEVYRTLVEATGFGAQVIIERVEEYGIKVENIIATGGIPEKNKLLMQIYADITGRELKVSVLSQACAVGSAIFGGIAGGYFKDVNEIQGKICRYKKKVFAPIPENKKVYKKLYSMYKVLHDSFGTKTYKKNLFNVMKELLKIKDEVNF